MGSRYHSKNEVSLKSFTGMPHIIQRTLLFCAILCVSVASAFAQDVITLKNGEDIQALVLEVGEVDIKYKKFDNPNGPNYTMKKLEIFMIRYANGNKDIFLEEEKTEKNNDNSSTNTIFTLKKSSKIEINVNTVNTKKKINRLLEKKMKKLGFCCLNKSDIISTENTIIVIQLVAPYTYGFSIYEKSRKVFDKKYFNSINVSLVVSNFIGDITPFIEE